MKTPVIPPSSLLILGTFCRLPGRRQSFALGGAAAVLGCCAAFAAPSSSSQLAVSADGRWLVTANIDSGTIGVIDTTSRKMVREVSVGHRPECAAFAGPSALVLVTLYKDDVLAFVDTTSGAVLERLATGDEPYGVVVTDDGKTAYVSLDFPGEVVEIDVPGRAVRRRFPVGHFARGLALGPDEGKLYVTEFYSAALTILDTRSGKVIERLEGESADNLGRQVALHPHRPKAYLPHLRSRVTNAHGEGSIFPFVTVVSLNSDAERRRSPIAMDTFNGFLAVANPWEVVLSRDGKRLYSVYSGTNDMHVCEVIDDDYRELSRKATVKVGSHPRAVALSPDDRMVYVYDTLDFQVRCIDAEKLDTVALVPCATPPSDAAWVRGKVLFNSALEPWWAAGGSRARAAIPTGRPMHAPGTTRKACAIRRGSWGSGTRCRFTGRPTVTRCRTSRRRSWGRSCKAEDWGAARHTQRSKPRTAASLRTSTRSRSIRRRSSRR